MSPQSYRPPSREDHQSFCNTEAWSLTKNARGKNTGHHVTYNLTLTDGRILRTRISRPVDRTSYSATMFQHVLKEQLDCTKQDFFACVDHKILPPRPQVQAIPKDGLPLYIAEQLVNTVGLAPSEIKHLSVAQALEVLTLFYIRSNESDSRPGE